MATFTYTNSTSQTGYSLQQNVAVSNLDAVYSDISSITLSVTWSNSMSWQGVECYVYDPDGQTHYIFNSGSLFGSGSRTDTLTVSTDNWPSSMDGDWEFYLDDQMYNSFTVSSTSLIAEVTSDSFKAYYMPNINGLTGFSR